MLTWAGYSKVGVGPSRDLFKRRDDRPSQPDRYHCCPLPAAGFGVSHLRDWLLRLVTSKPTGGCEREDSHGEQFSGRDVPNGRRRWAHVPGQ